MSKGIDTPINELIDLFLTNLWTSKTRQFYGRIFRNEKRMGFIIKIQPLYYVGTEAVDPLKDDRKDAQCFVDVMPDRKMFADVIEAECRILFMVNLLALYPSLTHTEAVEQVMADVKRQIMLSEFETIQMVSGYEAFNDYHWSEDALSDLQNHHLFRFDLLLTYIND
jgi:hypothetical protein